MAKMFSVASTGWRKHCWLLYCYPTIESGLQTSDEEIAEARQFFWRVTGTLLGLLLALAWAGYPGLALLAAGVGTLLQSVVYDSLLPLSATECGEMLELVQKHPELEAYRQQVLAEVRQFRRADLWVARSGGKRLDAEAKCRALYQE